MKKLALMLIILTLFTLSLASAEVVECETDDDCEEGFTCVEGNHANTCMSCTDSDNADDPYTDGTVVTANQTTDGDNIEFSYEDTWYEIGEEFVLLEYSCDGAVLAHELYTCDSSSSPTSCTEATQNYCTETDNGALKLYYSSSRPYWDYESSCSETSGTLTFSGDYAYFYNYEYECNEENSGIDSTRSYCDSCEEDRFCDEDYTTTTTYSDSDGGEDAGLAGYTTRTDSYVASTGEVLGTYMNEYKDYCYTAVLVKKTASANTGRQKTAAPILTTTSTVKMKWVKVPSVLKTTMA